LASITSRKSAAALVDDLSPTLCSGPRPPPGYRGRPEAVDRRLDDRRRNRLPSSARLATDLGLAAELSRISAAIFLSSSVFAGSDHHVGRRRQANHLGGERPEGAGSPPVMTAVPCHGTSEQRERVFSGNLRNIRHLGTASAAPLSPRLAGRGFGVRGSIRETHDSRIAPPHPGPSPPEGGEREKKRGSLSAASNKSRP